MKKQLYIAALLLTGALAACQNDESLASAYENDPNAVRIRPTIAAPQARVNTAGNGATWTDGDQIVVVNTSTNAVTGKTTASYTYSGGLWDLTGSTYMVWADGVNSFQAWYPATGGTTFDTFVLPKNQTDNERGTGKHFIGDADWMLATAGREQTSALDLTFDHQLVKVTVTITQYNDEYPSNVTVANPVFTVPTTPAVIADKTLSVEDNATTVNGLMTEDTNGLHSFTAVLLPGSYSPGDDFLQLTVAGETLTVKANALLTNTGLEACMAYTFNLTVGKNSLGITGVTVSAWGSGWEKGGTATEQPGANPNTHSIRTTEAGQIAAAVDAGDDWITEAVGTGTSLTISGPMNEDDFTALKTYLNNLSGITIDLDLSGAVVTAIPDRAFQEVTSLGQVSLPVTLTKIGIGAFRICSSFTITNWDKLVSLETIGMNAFFVFNSGDGLSGDIVLPESITSIEMQAFYETGITSIVIPSGVTVIDNQLFYRCSSLKKVVCKGPVSSFGIRPFCECSALEEVDLSACTGVPVYDSSNRPFSGLSAEQISQIKLIVDKDMVSAFEADSYWSQCDIVDASTIE